MKRYLAQLNIATLRHPMDDPRTADFANALPAVNGAGEQSSGYVWRLQSDSGDATDIQVFDDPRVIVNLTVWESLEALKAFAYRGIHRDFFRRRAEWFVAGSTRTALWWLPAGSIPTTDDAKRRLEFLEVFGSSPYAFAMGQSQPALVIDHVVDVDDHPLTRYLNDGASHDHECVVAAELDDVPVACGAYRRLDDTTAEVKRMYVAQTARGMRLGAAILSELEAAATRNGLQRLVLETWPKQLAALERFGFRHCTRSGASELSPESIVPESIVMEKTLTA